MTPTCPALFYTQDTVIQKTVLVTLSQTSGVWGNGRAGRQDEPWAGGSCQTAGLVSGVQFGAGWRRCNEEQACPDVRFILTVTELQDPRDRSDSLRRVTAPGEGWGVVPVGGGQSRGEPVPQMSQIPTTGMSRMTGQQTRALTAGGNQCGGGDRAPKAP